MSKMVLRHGVLGSILEIHRKIFKNILLQNHLAWMLENRYVFLPGGLLQFCSNKGPRIQTGPVPGGPRFKPWKYIENIQKSSSSELLGLDAGNLVCSIAEWSFNQV